MGLFSTSFRIRSSIRDIAKHKTTALRHLEDTQLEVLPKWDKPYAKADGTQEVHTIIIVRKVWEPVTEFNYRVWTLRRLRSHACFAYFYLSLVTNWT